MQVKLDQPLDFIREKNLVDFIIVHRNGANLIVAGQFSQNVKTKEIEQIMAHNILKPSQTPAVPVVKKTSKQLFKEAEKAKKEEDELAAKEKVEVDEKTVLAGNDNKPSEKL